MNKPIIIVGMHRSGTSMLTRFFEKANIFMGADKEGNDEAKFFLKLNEWILRQNNCGWDNVDNLKFEDEKFDDEIIDVLNKQLHSPRIIQYMGLKKYIKYRSFENFDFRWGWKDPRNSLFLKYWLRIFPEAKIVHIYRNPVDVAYSLSQRSKSYLNWNRNYKHDIKKYLLMNNIITDSVRTTNIEEGFKLWKDYINIIHSFEAKENIIHIKYEDLLENPLNEFQKLSHFLAIDLKDNIIQSIADDIKSDREYAFLRDNELITFYKKIKTDSLMVKLGYDAIN
jgi:hypothetical protein